MNYIGFIWGIYRDKGKEHGSCYILGFILGLCRDNGKRKWKLLYYRVYVGHVLRMC